MSHHLLNGRVDTQCASGQAEDRRGNFAHLRIVMGGNHNGGAQFIEFYKEAHQTLPYARIHISRRLIRQQQIRFGDDRPGDGNALLFTPDKVGGLASIRSPKPTQFSNSSTSSR